MNNKTILVLTFLLVTLSECLCRPPPTDGVLWWQTLWMYEVFDVFQLKQPKSQNKREE